MASKTISISSEDDSQDDDGVWGHKPLKRVKKSSSQYPSSQQQNTSSMSSSRSTPREAGIPHTQSQCYGAGSESAGSGGVTPTIPSSTQPQGRSLHQSRRKIFDSSQKANKRNSAIKSSQSSAKPKKSGKMSQSQTNNDRSHIKTESETNDTEENNQKYCPMCQAPRSSIHLRSLEGHIEDCLEFEKPDIECPDGQFCSVTILGHYQKFSHNVLALTRSEMLPNHSVKMEEDEPKADKSHLKAEMMTSDSDFERPSSSQFRTRSNPCEEFDFKIKGDRVTCTPKRIGSSQVSASQSKPQLKNTARKSLKGAINRNQRKSNRMEAVKEEVPTPRKSEHQRESKEASTRYQENISKEGNLQRDSHQSSKTPCSQNKTAAKSGSSSRKRRKSAWDDIPESGSLLDYFSPSQKTADARLNEAPHSPLPKMKTIPHSAHDSEDSQPFVESDLDIFEEIDNEPIDLDRADKSEALTASDKCKDQFTKLKSKQDRTEMPGDLDSLGSDDDKPADEPLFDILDGLEDTAGEESDSIFSPQSSNFVENTTTSVDNQAKKSNSPNFIDVPPAPVPDNDTSDDELPQFDLTCRSLEDSSDESRDKASNIRPQDSTNDGQCNDGEAMEEGSQDEESESLFNIPGENKQINLPPLVPNEGISAEEESQSLFNIPDQNKEQEEESQRLFNIPAQNKEQEEESQSLFNIPAQNKEQEEESQSLFNIPGQSKEQESLADDFNPGKLHVDNTEVCSENEEEMMDIDDDDDHDHDDEEQTNKKEMLGCPAGTMTAKEEASLRPADFNTSISAQAVHSKSRKQGNLDSFLGCKPVPAKSRKQGNLDSFLGCKPVPKVESQPQTSKPKGQWRGSKQTSHRSKGGEGQERKEWGNNSGKQCPFYKKMPGTSFTVDAFRYGIIPGCKAYFLSHFHYDHYGGLTKHFDQQLYCSKVTGNLVTSRLKVAAKNVINLPMNEPCIIDDVEVTLLDANHCPGSVMFLYKLKSGSIYLHTGDFRADAKMEQFPQLSCCRVNQLYLDTTYCDPQYKFPAQKEVIEFAVQTAVNAVSRNKKTLIVCGTYTIGKEKVFRAIAEALACKVYVESQKFKVLECLEDDELMSILTKDNQATRLHVIGMNMFSHQKLKEYLSKMSPRYDHILAFQPTGWTHSDKAQ